MTEPTIHDQEHLMAELKKPSLEQQAEIFQRQMLKAKDLDSKKLELEDILEHVRDFIDDETHRISNQIVNIRNDAKIQISPQAYKMWQEKYGRRWTTHEDSEDFTGDAWIFERDENESRERTLIKEIIKHRLDTIEKIKQLGDESQEAKWKLNKERNDLQQERIQKEIAKDPTNPIKKRLRMSRVKYSIPGEMDNENFSAGSFDD